MPLDSIAVFTPIDRITDANGAPVPGGSVEFYAAGTSTPFTVYSDNTLSTPLGTIVYLDSGGFPVTSQGSSTKTLVYTGTSAYKMIVKDTNGAVVLSFDNIRGASVSPASSTTAYPVTPTISKTTTYTIQTTDQGKLINANCTGGSFALTLPSAVTAGDSWRIGVRHVGTQNQITIVVQGSQTISRSGVASTTLPLAYYGETVWLVSDGANWSVDSYVPRHYTGGEGMLVVADRLTSAPGSPVSGARYIISGSPSGTWATLGYSANDVVEYDGNGSWTKYTPYDGLFAYVANGTTLYQYRTSSWVALSNITAPTSTNLQYAVWEHQATNGTGGGTPTANAWTTRPITTEVINNITGASLASNNITLPVGKYLVTVQQAFYSTSGTSGVSSAYEAKQRIVANTATLGANDLYGLSMFTGGVWTASGFSVSYYGGSALSDTYLIDVQVAGSINLQYYVNAAYTNGLGSPSAEPNNAAEVYARVAVLALNSLQGPQGTTGLTGAAGTNGTDGGVRWLFASSTTMADPSAGNFRLNNATMSSVTAAAFSANSGETGNPSVLAFLQAWDDSTTTAHRGYILLKKTSAPQNFAIYDITGALTDNTTWVQLALTYVASSGSFSASDVIGVEFVRTGDAGSTGGISSLSPGSGITSNTAATAPGSALTSAGTLSQAELVNAQTGTTYTVVDGDRAKLLTLSNASPVAVTLPQANATTTFVSGWFVDVMNKGAGTVTITPTTSTINGASSLNLVTGAGVRIVSDGTNYQITRTPVSVGGSTTQIQYNSSGSLAGAAGLIFDGTSKVTLGVAGASVGGVSFNNATSGSITLQPVTGALGAVTLSLPAATDTLVGKATTDTLTNKTISGASNTITNVSLATGVTGNLPVTNLNSGTGASSSTFWRGDGSWAAIPATSLTVGSTVVSGGTTTRVLFDNAGVLGEYTISGSGNVAMTTSPSFTTPVLGTPTSGTLTNCTGLPLTTGITGTLGVGNGGTGASLSATGGTSQVLRQSTVGGAVTVSQIAASDLSNGTTGSGAVALATSPTFVTPVLGTPTSGTMTNCTGLPISTGVSGLGTGVATALAAGVTGSGNIVLATSPTLVTPTLGAASATSVTASGLLQAGTTLGISTDTLLSRATAASWQLGAADAPSAVAQTLGVQNVVAGTTNIAGANFTIKGSAGTGTGAGGSIIFQVAPAGTTGTAQNAFAAALTIDSTKKAAFASDVTAGSIFSTDILNSCVWVGGNATVNNSKIQASNYRLGMASDIPLTWSSSTTTVYTADLYLSRAAAASLQLGAADAAAPVAQTLGVQNVVAGTTNTAGSNFTIKGSAGTGTGAGGDIIFQTAKAGSSGTAQNTLAEAFRIKGTGPAVVLSGGGVTVANLPAAVQGGLAFVTDANATTRGTTVVGGGANKLPVYSDGTNWIIA